MKSILTKDFGVFAAESLERNISTGYDFLYAMMGRSAEWPNADALETPYDTTDYKNSIFKNGIILKRVVGSDIQAVVPRIDWTADTLYTAYDQTANLFITTKATEIIDCLVTVDGEEPTTVTANVGFDLTFDFSVGDIIRISEVDKEIISVNSAGDFLTVNTAYDLTYTEEICYKITTESPEFYVRNTSDQVFKCLYNNDDSDSVSMPEITLGGELPENPYIQTADGYKWKYMYTIPSGLKKKFFTSDYMPVLRESVVYNNAENGRIDVIQITSGGTGYYNGSNVTNYPILTISGDGTGANATVDVTLGVITDVNIVDGGNDYTTANLSISDPLQTLAGTNAAFKAIISPQYGHGYDPARELGASYLMISTDFQGTVESYLPTPTGSDDVRQFCLLRNPRLASNGATSTASIYPMYTKLYVENRTEFTVDSMIINSAGTFSANVVFYDTADDAVYINNINGNVDSLISLQVYQSDDLTKYAQVFSVEKPSINISSGEIIYVENRAAIIRDADQTETLKIVIGF